MVTTLIALLVPSADCVDLPPTPRVYADDAHAFRRAVDGDQRKEAALPMIQDAADSATAAEVANSGTATATNDRHQHPPKGK